MFDLLYFKVCEVVVEMVVLSWVKFYVKVILGLIECE